MRPIAVACAAAFAASLIFGGTTRGGLPEMITQIASLPLLVLVLPEAARVLRGNFLAGAVLAASLAIPLLQLIPLPQWIWSTLPGRAPIAETFSAAGLASPWLGLSVSPYATVRVALSLLPTIAIFLGVLACRREERRVFWILALIAGLGSTILEMMQILEGPESALRFYAPTDSSAGVGVFANRNHAAALLYSLIPIGAALYMSAERGRSLAGALALGGFYVAIVLGLMMTGSRSALMLGAVSFALTFAFVLRPAGGSERKRRRGAVWLVIAATAATALLLAPSFGLMHILERFAQHEMGPGDRYTISLVSLQAARAFLPFGSGLGTFERVYPLFQSKTAISPAIVNHAHDDALEIILEAGLPGGLVMLAAIALMIRCVWRNRREPNPILAKERAAALIVILLLCSHSLFDYPLRMPALAALFAVCAATACGVFRAAAAGEGLGRPRRREEALRVY
jgi:hypothetical protein